VSFKRIPEGLAVAAMMLAAILRQRAAAPQKIGGHQLYNRLQLGRMLMTTARQVSHITLADSALIRVELVRREEGVLRT
jgi:hypothetical protein